MKRPVGNIAERRRGFRGWGKFANVDIVDTIINVVGVKRQALVIGWTTYGEHAEMKALVIGTATDVETGGPPSIVIGLERRQWAVHRWLSAGCRRLGQPAHQWQPAMRILLIIVEEYRKIANP